MMDESAELQEIEAWRAGAEANVAVATHQVLINTEEQHCLWPAEKSIPNGWSSVFSGVHQECLDYVASSWTDMRPKSTRVL